MKPEDVKVGVIYATTGGGGRGREFWSRYDRKVLAVKQLDDTARKVVTYVRRGGGKVPFGGKPMRCYADNFFRTAGKPVPA